jgi:hypothetical protein
MLASCSPGSPVARSVDARTVELFRQQVVHRAEAQTPALVTISGGPWPTRRDALVHLVLDYQSTRQPI